MKAQTPQGGRIITIGSVAMVWFHLVRSIPRFA